MFKKPHNAFFVLTAEVFIGIAILFLPLIFFKEELVSLMLFLSQQVGPTFYVLLIVSMYLFGGILLACFERDHRKLPKILLHLDITAGICMTIGMIGTYISFVDALGQGGIPEPKHFSNALFSTLWALVITALVSAANELLRVIRMPYTHLNWSNKNDNE